MAKEPFASFKARDKILFAGPRLPNRIAILRSFSVDVGTDLDSQLVIDIALGSL